VTRRRFAIEYGVARELIDGAGGLLNHVEMVHRPGERALVSRLFAALGCAVVDTGGQFLVIHADPGAADPRMLDNCLYASEVAPEQWRFEEALRARLSSDAELGASYAAFAERAERRPQSSTHFGIRMTSPERLEEILERVDQLRRGQLGERVTVAGVLRPGDPGSLSSSLIQAFVRTDVCAAGLLCFGQHIELQAIVG
jgi:hypothetical protein